MDREHTHQRTLKEYIQRAYVRRHEPESMHILADVYWWGIVLVSIMVVIALSILGVRELFYTQEVLYGHSNSSNPMIVKNIIGFDPAALEDVLNTMNNNTPPLLPIPASSSAASSSL